MKRAFVIEVDSEFSTVFVYEVSKGYSKDGDIVYTRLSSDTIIQSFPTPKFYGQLDALMLTRERIGNAEPIIPEPAEVL